MVRRDPALRKSLVHPPLLDLLRSFSPGLGSRLSLLLLALVPALPSAGGVP
jgi:hypothetical protein